MESLLVAHPPSLYKNVDDRTQMMLIFDGVDIGQVSAVLPSGTHVSATHGRVVAILDRESAFCRWLVEQGY